MRVLQFLLAVGNLAFGPSQVVKYVNIAVSIRIVVGALRIACVSWARAGWCDVHVLRSHAHLLFCMWRAFGVG
eukprot:8523944-Alexandrium_andersonii.AAC.1